MANHSLFASHRGAHVPTADTRNEAGGLAYARRPEATLALYAATGCLNGTFYADAETQLDTMLALCAKVDPRFVAKTAIYARRTAFGNAAAKASWPRNDKLANNSAGISFMKAVRRA